MISVNREMMQIYLYRFKNVSNQNSVIIILSVLPCISVRLVIPDCAMHLTLTNEHSLQAWALQ